MTGFLENLKSATTTYSKYIVIIIVLIIFIFIGKYVYDSFFSKKNNKFTNVANASPDLTATNVAKIYFFNVDWCPHCKTAVPIWQEFCEDNDGKVFGNYKLECVGGKAGTNCTNDSDANINSLITKFNIEGYPTVKIVKDGEQIEYGTKITKETLEQYVNAVLV